MDAYVFGSVLYIKKSLQNMQLSEAAYLVIQEYL